MEHDLRTPDGRTLHVIEDGDPDGLPVVVHHGTPGCALQYEPHAVDAAERGIRLISYDRPWLRRLDARTGGEPSRTQPPT